MQMYAINFLVMEKIAKKNAFIIKKGTLFRLGYDAGYCKCSKISYTKNERTP